MLYGRRPPELLHDAAADRVRLRFVGDAPELGSGLAVLDQQRSPLAIVCE